MIFPKVVVALDRSSMDQKLIQYSYVIVQHLAVVEVSFFHIVPYVLPPHLIGYDREQRLRKELFLTQDQQRKLLNTIRIALGDINDLDVQLCIIEGRPQRKLLTTVQQASPDLLVLGKKHLGKGSGIIAQRVARKVTSAIWFVTEQANSHVRNILVPIDFSAYSIRALKAALYLKQQLKEVRIFALYVIDIPMSAYQLNGDKDRMLDTLKSSTKASFDQLLRQHQISAAEVTLIMLMNEDFDIAQYIQQVALKEVCDLIVVGARGRSGSEGFVFGSVTEKLITCQDLPPLLVIR